MKRDFQSFYIIKTIGFKALRDSKTGTAFFDRYKKGIAPITMLPLDVVNVLLVVK